MLRPDSTARRVAYGHTLLKVETTFHHPGLGVVFVGIFGRGVALRFRIESLLTQPMRHPLMKTALRISLAVLTSLGVTQAALPEALISKAYLFLPFQKRSGLFEAVRRVEISKLSLSTDPKSEPPTSRP